MSRWLAVVAFSLAISVTGPIATSTDLANAQGKKAPKSDLKQCRAKAPSGKLVTWKCKSDQPCCMNMTTGQGVCGSPVIGCL
jgi:hypothetical protein